MLRITIELVPHGFEERKRTLGIAEIVNDGTGSQDVGNYNIRFSKWHPKTKEIWKKGRITGFQRLKFGPWDLLMLALVSCIGDRAHKYKAPLPTCYGTFNAMHQRCDRCEAKDTCKHEHKEAK